jgi:hypothetical protein
MKVFFAALLSVSIAFTCSLAGAAPYAAAAYKSSTGDLYVYATSGIGLLGFGTLSPPIQFKTTEPAKMGGLSPAQFDPEILAYFRATGLPGGLYSLGPVLPPFLGGLGGVPVGFSYTPLGQPSVEKPITPEVLTPFPAALYNPSTGDLRLHVAASQKAILLESPGLFQLGATPTLGGLAPAQFDAKNLMFFDGDNDLSAGVHHLSAILPLNLDPSMIQLTVVGNEQIMNFSVESVPEPSTLGMAIFVSIACGGLVRRAKSVN